MNYKSHLKQENSYFYLNSRFNCCSLIAGILFAPISIFYFILLPGTASANPVSSEKTSISVKFDDPVEKEESESFLPQIEEIFQNSALISGLNSGADAINRSVESLMEALFYKLMDNEFIHKMNGDSWISLSGGRKVYSTSTGGFVVVDNITFGPRYNKELWNIHGVPINLGIDGSLRLLEIYPRTDAGRVAEQEELPVWRKWVNNWFGVLPLLTRILPPSFNPNEMYDPFRQLEVSYSFPLSIDTFKNMPIGSIRSYGISGGIRLPLGIGNILDNNTQKLISKAANFTATLPLTLFSFGEHRINVLRKSNDIAWVGLSTVKRTGQSLAGVIGNTLFLLSNVIDTIPWAGIPTPLFPIDISLTGALSKKFDQLYEYDLTKEDARKAYLDAVKGDFVLSEKLSSKNSRKANSKVKENGVRYHFTKVQVSTDANIDNSRNIFVTRQGRTQNRTKAEIEINDQKGQFFILEASQDVQDENWDLLVGNEETRNRSKVELNVDRIESADPETEEKIYDYKFSRKKEPFAITLNLQITDRYTDSLEYRNYIEEIRLFTGIELNSLPDFPKIDEERACLRRRSIYLADPSTEAQAVFSTPLVLGRFNGNASINFDTAAINAISGKSEDELWKAFALAFDQDPNNWGDKEYRDGALMQLLWFERLLFYPLRIFNYRSFRADAIHEANNAILSLKSIKSSVTPMDKLDGFYQLFDTDHPRRLASALLNVSDKKTLPRKVSFFTKPVGRLSPGLKQRYLKLSGRTEKAGTKFPSDKRYQVAQDKLSAFFPTGLKESRHRPIITDINIRTKIIERNDLKIPGGRQEKDDSLESIDRTKHLYLIVSSKNTDPSHDAKIFIRFEQSGKVQFGKLVIAEDVTTVKAMLDPTDEPTGKLQAKEEEKNSHRSQAMQADVDSKVDTGQDKPKMKLGTLTYHLFLSGPQSAFNSFILDQALDFGGEFQITISLSTDNINWSDEKVVKFYFEDGRLSPP